MDNKEEKPVDPDLIAQLKYIEHDVQNSGISDGPLVKKGAIIKILCIAGAIILITILALLLILPKKPEGSP